MRFYYFTWFESLEFTHLGKFIKFEDFDMSFACSNNKCIFSFVQESTLDF